MEWTNEAVMQFLELYQTKPCIWDAAHADHKNRNVVADAWSSIHELLNFSITLNELKKKKDSLMASFRMLLNKKKKCIKSGMGRDELFQPTWFAYQTMEKFLAPVYHCTPTTNTETDDTDAASQSTTNEAEDVADDNDVDDKEGRDEEVETAKPSRKSAESQKIVKPNLTPKRLNKKNIGAPEKRMEEAFQILKDATQTRKEREKDECDLYGELLAKKLRRFHEQEREEVMLDIDTMLLEKKRKQLPIGTASPTYTILSSRPSSSSGPSMIEPVLQTLLTTEASNNTENPQYFETAADCFQNYFL